MAQHWTSAQLQAIMSTNIGALKPYQLKAVMNALDRVPHTEDPDGSNGADEKTIAQIFPNGGLNP